MRDNQAHNSLHCALPHAVTDVRMYDALILITLRVFDSDINLKVKLHFKMTNQMATIFWWKDNIG